MSAPVAVRDHNPGAIWPGAVATKWGSAASEQLTDAQKNQAAVFPDNVHGAAAQFDLLRNVYVGMAVRPALDKWGGGNGLDSYVEDINQDTGLSGDDRLTLKYLSNPKTGIPFAQSMARHETGYIFPMSDADWLKAHQMVFGSNATLMVGPDGVMPAGDPFNIDRTATLGERILHRALSHIGETETSADGKHDIVEWAHNLGVTSVTSADFPWCADFTGAMMALEGAQVPPPDDALLARSYLKVGQTVVETSELQPGDIAIWPRGNGMGHVNIVESYDNDTKTVVCIGGNQNDMVSRAAPRSIEEALGFTRPVPSKLRPNGTKSVVDTVSESPSLKMFLQAKLAALAGGAAWVWNGLTGDMAGTATQVSGVMTPAKGIVAGAGIPLTTEVLFGLTAIIICSIAYRQLKQRQIQPQRQV